MPGFRCETCAINVNSQQQFTQHLSGKAHLRKVKEKTVAGGTWDPLEALASKPKLYGSFVPASSATESENNTNNVNKQPPHPGPFPSLVAMKKTPTGQEGLVQPKSEIVLETKPETQSSATQAGIYYPSGSLTPPPPPPPPPKVVKTNTTPIVQAVAPRMLAKTNINPVTQSHVNPVVQAVVDNALGKLPTKRKLYEGSCKVCRITFNSASQESQHFQGAKHAKKVKLMAVSPDNNVPIEPATTFVCQFCNVTVNSLVQFEAHRSGAKHLANFGKFKAAQTAHRKTQNSSDATTQTNTALPDQQNVVVPST